MRPLALVSINIISRPCMICTLNIIFIIRSDLATFPPPPPHISLVEYVVVQNMFSIFKQTSRVCVCRMTSVWIYDTGGGGVSWSQTVITLYTVIQQTRGIHPMPLQCWPTVFDAGPKLKQHWLNAPCLLDRHLYIVCLTLKTLKYII